MWRDEMIGFGRVFALGFAATTCGCASMVVVAEREGGLSESRVLRLATERGIKDLSTDEWRVLEVPIEVRADSLEVVIPGCAVRPFRAPDLDEVDFALDNITEDDSLGVIAAPAGIEIEGVPWRPGVVFPDPSPGGLDPDSLVTPEPSVAPDSLLAAGVPEEAFQRRPVVIPPHSSQMVTATVAVRRSVLGGDEIGLRLDSSPDALGALGPCPSPISSSDSLYVDHYLLPGVLVETGGVALASTALLLLAIILVTR